MDTASSGSFGAINHSLGALHLRPGQGIAKGSVELGQLDIDDVFGPLAAHDGHGTDPDVSAPVALTEVGNLVHRLGLANPIILFLELGRRHLLWARAPAQQDGKQ
jgi:hypothetical protein